MFALIVSKDMKNYVADFDKWEINEQEGEAPSLKSQVQWNPCFAEREVAIGKVVAHLCLTLIVKELKIRIEQGRMGNNIKFDQIFYILFCVVSVHTKEHGVT